MKQKKVKVSELKRGEFFTLTDFSDFDCCPANHQIYFRRFYMPKEKKYLVSNYSDICLTLSMSGDSFVFAFRPNLKQAI